MRIPERDRIVNLFSQHCGGAETLSLSFKNARLLTLPEFFKKAVMSDFDPVRLSAPHLPPPAF